MYSSSLYFYRPPAGHKYGRFQGHLAAVVRPPLLQCVANSFIPTPHCVLSLWTLQLLQMWHRKSLGKCLKMSLRRRGRVVSFCSAAWQQVCKASGALLVFENALRTKNHRQPHLTVLTPLLFHVNEQRVKNTFLPWINRNIPILA